MIPRITETNTYYDEAYYFCTVDFSQKDRHHIDVEGSALDLIIINKANNNHRVSHPNVGTITHCVGKSQFEVGDKILCHHFTFEDVNRKRKVHHIENGVEYFKVTNRELFFKIDGDQLIPREGNLLCEAIYGKLIDTFLELPESLVDKRRDTVKVVTPWEGCEEFKTDDYIMLQRGGDYELTFNGRSFLKVDSYFKDIMAIVGDPEWRVSEVRKHVKDYNQKIQI